MGSDSAEPRGIARHMVAVAETYLFSQEDEDVRVDMASELATQVPVWLDQGVDPVELTVSLAEVAAHLVRRLSDATDRPVSDVLKDALVVARDVPSAEAVDPAGLAPRSRARFDRRHLKGTTGYHPPA